MALSDSILKEIEDLQGQAESLLVHMGEEPTNSECVALIEELDLIHSAIEDLEYKLEPLGMTANCATTQICNTAARKLEKLDNMLQQLAKFTPRNVEVVSRPISQLFASVILLVESLRDLHRTMKLGDLLGCVSVAERPDFSSVQLMRICTFEFDKDEEVEIGILGYFLGLAQLHSTSERPQTIKLNPQGIVHESPNRAGLSVCLVVLGLSNKVEQLFSPTSVINTIAKVCYAISRSLLADFCLLSTIDEDTAWIPLVFPQYSKQMLPFQAILTEAVNLWEASYDESGTYSNLNRIKKPLPCMSEEQVGNGHSVLGVSFLLRSVGGRSPLDMTWTQDGRLKILHSTTALIDPTFISVAGVFLRNIQKQPHCITAEL